MTLSDTETAAPSPTDTASVTPSPSATEAANVTATLSATPSPAPSDTATATDTATAAPPGSKASPTASLSATSTPSPTASATLVASATPTAGLTTTASASPTATHTATTQPSPTPTATQAYPFATPSGNRPHGFNNFKLSFVGANIQPQMAGFDRLDTHVSFFQGDVSSRWHADVPTWEGVRYTNLYPGLDLEISSQAGQWAWHLVVRNPSTGLPQLANVAWQVGGADQLSLTSQRLELQSAVGNYALPLLHVVDGNGVELSAAQLRAAGASAPSLTGSQLRQPFAALATIGSAGRHGLMAMAPVSLDQPVAHARSAPLLDPSPPSYQVYGTYLGGQGFGVTTDRDGNAYVTGLTYDADFTYTVGYSQVQNAGADGFVIKVSSDGTSLYYLTHLGGDDDDIPLAIAVDDNGAAYVTGYTLSDDYPTTLNAYDATENGDGPMLSKLSPDGAALDYSSYVGTGIGQGVAVRPHANDVAYLVGLTGSGYFSTTANAYAVDPAGDYEGFLAQIDTTQSVLILCCIPPILEAAVATAWPISTADARSRWTAMATFTWLAKLIRVTCLQQGAHLHPPRRATPTHSC